MRSPDSRARSAPVHFVLWRNLAQPGHDACGLWATREGWRLAGTAIFVQDGLPCQLAYEVACDRKWRTRIARIRGSMGVQPLTWILAVAPGERWKLDGVAQPEVGACPDLDLSFTPATNLIAIRRLALAPGEKADAPAAWFRFPEARLLRLEQRYHRVGYESYAYEAPTEGYAGLLKVSEAGFVLHYPGLWEAEATA